MSFFSLHFPLLSQKSILELATTSEYFQQAKRLGVTSVYCTFKFSVPSFQKPQLAVSFGCSATLLTTLPKMQLSNLKQDDYYVASM